jgi:phospholipid-translocating ATPase
VVILPLIVILAITAAKDGYEDFKRHQSDRRVNNSRLRVLAGGNHSNANVTKAKSKTFVRAILPKSRKSGKLDDVEFDSGVNESEAKDSSVSRAHWKQTTWEDLRVGDFVKIMDNEQFPADILICSTSEDENVAFVETKNLDGETNLKSRQAVPALADFNNAEACSKARFEIQCDRPDTDMYRLNATLTLNGEKSPIDLTSTLLRGTVLRNTGWVIGVVMFTGQDSKIVLNSGGTPSKRSKVERQMNPQVYVLLFITSTWCSV